MFVSGTHIRGWRWVWRVIAVSNQDMYQIVGSYSAQAKIKQNVI